MWVGYLACFFGGIFIGGLVVALAAALGPTNPEEELLALQEQERERVKKRMRKEMREQKRREKQ